MVEIRVRTSSRVEARDITEEVARVLRGREGRIVHLYTPHTTCGLAINENADPDVMRDVIEALGRIVPQNFPYRHREGNADSHIKSILTGSSVMVPLDGGSMRLGTWQGVFLMEFDGPRERTVVVNVL
jgi:secondary thiamine-phosphate synthase enzyme